MKNKERMLAIFRQIILYVLVACASLTMLWEAMNYERMIAQNPYPVLGRVVLMVKTLLLIAAVLGGIWFVWRKAEKQHWCRLVYRNTPVWLIIGLIAVIGLVVRGQIIATHGDAEKILSSMDYEISRYRAMLHEQPVAGTYADSYMLYAAKRSNEMLYQLWLLPGMMRLVGEGVHAVYTLNMLLEGLNIILAGICGWMIARKGGAGLAAALYACWPHAVLRCGEMAPILLTACLLLSAMALAMQLIRIAEGLSQGKRQFALVIILGVVLGLLMHASTCGVLIVLALVLLWLFRRRSSSENGLVLFLNAKLFSTGLMLGVVILTELAVVWGLRATTYHPVPDAVTASGYSVAVGLNAQGDGRWNQPDAQQLQDAANPVDAQRAFWQLAAERAGDMSWVKAKPLLAEKLNYHWRVFADMNTGTPTSPNGQPGRMIFSFLALLALALASVLCAHHRGWRHIDAVAAVFLAQWMGQLLLDPGQNMPMECWVSLIPLAMGVLCPLLHKEDATQAEAVAAKKTSLVFSAEKIIQGGVTISATQASAQQSLEEKGESSLYAVAADNPHLLVVEAAEKPAPKTKDDGDESTGEEAEQQPSED